MEATKENGYKDQQTKDSSKKVYKSEDFVICPVKEEDHEKYLTFLTNHFFSREPLTCGLHVTSSEFENLMGKLCKTWIASGASVCAVYVPGNELAGIMLAQILTKENSDVYVTGDVEKDPENVHLLMRVLRHIEKAVDIFQDPKIAKVAEIGATCVQPKFAGNRLAYRLAEEFEKLAIGLGCDAAISQSTNVITQHIRSKLGFEAIYTFDYETFELDGQKVIDLSQINASTKAVYMRKYLKQN